MNERQKANWKLAQEQAAEIVAAWRDACPPECRDARQLEGWVAGVAAVAAVGASAYSAYSSSKAKQDAANVAVPKYQGYTPTLAQYNPNAGIQGLQNAYQQYGGTAQNIANAENSYYQQSISALAPGTKQGIYLASKNANSELAGNIPADVQAQSLRNSAQANLVSGLGSGSGQGRNTVARDLDLTSLNLTNMGASNLANNTRLAQSLNPYSAGSILGTSQQYQQGYEQNQEYNANAQNQAAQVNAQGVNAQNQQMYQRSVNQALAPDPVASAAVAGVGAAASAYTGGLAGSAANANYYGVGNTGYNTNGYYATPQAANAAYGTGSQLGYTPGVGGGYYNTGYG